MTGAKASVRAALLVGSDSPAWSLSWVVPGLNGSVSVQVGCFTSCEPSNHLEPRAVGAVRAKGEAEWRGWSVEWSVDDGYTALSTPQGQLMANVMASFAAYERELIRQRTRDALQALRARGVRLGRPRAIPGVLAARIGAWRASGATLASIADALNRSKVPTAHGGERWRPSTVRGVLRSLELDRQS